MERTMQLETDERYFRSLIENISGAIVLLDADGKPLYQSPSTERISGYSLKEIQTLNPFDLIHPDDREDANSMFTSLIKFPGTTLQRNHRFKHKNGNYIWLEGTFTNLLEDESIKAIVLSYQDITQRILSEEKASLSNRLYQVISRINKMIIHVTDEQTLFKEACSIAVDFGKFKMACISIINEEERTLNPVVFAGIELEYFTRKKGISLDHPALVNGPIGEAIRTGTSAFSNNVEDDQKGSVVVDCRSYIALPVKKFGKIVGTFTLYTSTNNYFDEKEVALLEEVTGDISFTLENLEKERLRKHAEEEVLNIYKEKETTLNRINDSVVSLDNEWRYTFLNDAAMATHSEGREKTLGKVIWDVHPEMEGTIFWDKYHEAMQTRKVMEFESYFAPMNIWFFVKVYPSADGVTIFYRDITVQKKADEQIIAEKLLSDSIVKSLPGVFYLYNKEGKFLRWNKNFETVTKYCEDEISKMHPLDFFCEDEKQLLVEKISSTFSKGEENVQANFLLKTKEKIPYYFTGIAIDYQGDQCLMGVGIDFSERVKAQEKIKKTTEELRLLTAHLQSIREDERKRIGREIHDELGQQLTAIKMDVAWIDKKTPEELTLVKNKLKNVIELLDGSHQSIRRILSELRPNILDDYGLLEAIKWLGNQFTSHTNIPVIFITDETEIKSSEATAICIFRIYQEALTNITRYAQAKKVSTSLHIIDNTINIIIEDDGKGFDTSSVKTKNSFGILGMKERVLSLNGKFELHSSPNKGTRIAISLPDVNE